MTLPEARQILDAARLGADVDEGSIIRALVMTGDIGNRPPKSPERVVAQKVWEAMA